MNPLNPLNRSNRSARARMTAATAVLLFGSLAALAADQAKNLLKDPAKAASWRFEQFEQGQGKMKEDDGSILLDVTHAGAQNWNVQAFLTQLDLKDGQLYTFTYKIKGDPARTIAAIACIDQDDWHAVGFQEDIELTKDWKEHTHTFKAENVAPDAKNRIGFMVGSDAGKVWIKDVSLAAK
jgi:hypothetical protein